MTKAYDTNNRNRKIKRVKSWVKAKLFLMQQQAVRMTYRQAYNCQHYVPQHQMKGNNQISSWPLSPTAPLGPTERLDLITHTTIPLPGNGTHISRPSSNLVTTLTEVSRIHSASWDLRDLKNSPPWFQWYLTNCATRPKCDLYPLWAPWTTRALNCFQFQQQILRSDAGRDWLPSDHQTLSITLSLSLSGLRNWKVE